MPIKNYKKHSNHSQDNKKTKKINKFKIKRTIKIILIVFFTAILITIGIFCGKVYNVVKDAKIGIEKLVIKKENSIVKDKNDVTIATLSGTENREIISISKMSPYIPKAFVAIEDERFYSHSGIDVKRTIAATAKYALSKVGIGSASYGGSTITQQLVKNATEDKERRWERKVREIARSFYIEEQMSKHQILETYLNLIYLGDNTYGVEIASNYYFNKKASDLSLAESAFLAGINNSPEYYEPFSEEQKDKDKIRTRVLTVLNKLYELRDTKELTITEEEYNQAKKQVEDGLVFQKGTIRQTIYSYHTDAAINQVVKELKEKNNWKDEYARLYVASSGLVIHTTQDTAIQQKMEEVFANDKYKIASREIENTHSQAAMVIIDNKTGEVSATVGGIGEKTAAGLNRATQSPKPTGSVMKPLAVLVPGIDMKIITAGTSFDDSPGAAGHIVNSTGYRGLCTTRYAIESSQNIPMVLAINKIGTEHSIEYLKKMGITTLDDEKDNNQSLALGGLTYGVSPLEMAAAYATIQNDGIYVEPTFYTKVEDLNGNVILEKKQERRTVMSSQAAFIIKDILTQPVKSGTATSCRIPNMSVGAKTGTTSNSYDRWLCGFTPYYTAATWFGYDKNERVRFYGNPAGRIWKDVMGPIHKDLEPKYFSSSKPSEGLVTARICKSSGMLATDLCKADPRGDYTYTEYFIKGTVPKKACDCHISSEICVDTGKIANEHCPHKARKIFITRPDWETKTNWKRAKDAPYMFTIKDICSIHKAPVVIEPIENEKPKITLKGKKLIEIEKNQEFKDPGATAKDKEDGDISNKIKTEGTVNTKKEGKYTIIYTVTDSSGNIAKEERIVIVKDKSTVTPQPTKEPPPTTDNTTTNRR